MVEATDEDSRADAVEDGESELVMEPTDEVVVATVVAIGGEGNGEERMEWKLSRELCELSNANEVGEGVGEKISPGRSDDGACRCRCCTMSVQRLP